MLAGLGQLEDFIEARMNKAVEMNGLPIGVLDDDFAGRTAGLKCLDPGGHLQEKIVDLGRYALRLGGRRIGFGIVGWGRIAVGMSPAGFSVHFPPHADCFALFDRA